MPKLQKMRRQPHLLLQRRRDSVFWPMLVTVLLFCLAMIAATQYAARVISQTALRLDDQTVRELDDYARQAGQAIEQGPEAVQLWLEALRQREQVWATVVDTALQSLGTELLTAEQLRDVRFARSYRSYLSRRGGDYPMIRVQISDQSDLLMRLPERFHPWSEHALIIMLALYVVPTVLVLFFCLALYLLWVSPLKRISRMALEMQVSEVQSSSFSADFKRKDELGVLVRSLDFFAQRLAKAYEQQRELLRALSHEVRTPLSRLQVALDTGLTGNELDHRVAREVKHMRELVDRTLQLAWLDGDGMSLPVEPVDLAALWDLLVENAMFESSWPLERFLTQIPEPCYVRANLDGLAQVLENILRNSIRYSPADSQVLFSVEEGTQGWLLHVEDQGPGVAQDDLEKMFNPFDRLGGARPSEQGFGLGLAIARRLVQLMGGDIYAENLPNGFRVTVELQFV